MRNFRLPLLLLGLLAVLSAWGADEQGAWHTAYVKRGFVGNYDAGWAGGVGATLRMPVAIAFAGTRVRVHVRGCFDAETVLTKMALVRGADEKGKIAGPLYPITFAGQPGLTLAKGLKEAVSDPIDVPITPGAWYLEDCYSSQKYPYAYEVDGEYSEAGDQFEKPTLARTIRGSRLGIVTRVDVFTTDARPILACWGDSITHGYNSTPFAGHRYPTLLGKLLDAPTLNFGVNGDQAVRTGGMAGEIGAAPGVGGVVFLMGINDIIGNPKFTKDSYVQAVKTVIAGCRQRQWKFYLGTILPAGGCKSFDADPAREALRVEINDWIRTKSGADAVIDFAAALADPAQPTKLQADYQSGDWLHPSDAGYQKMAETAAAVIKGK